MELRRLDSPPTNPRSKSEKLKPRRIRRQEMRCCEALLRFADRDAKGNAK
jgi:hypothetical protein